MDAIMPSVPLGSRLAELIVRITADRQQEQGAKNYSHTNLA